MPFTLWTVDFRFVTPYAEPKKEGVQNVSVIVEACDSIGAISEAQYRLTGLTLPDALNVTAARIGK